MRIPRTLLFLYLIIAASLANAQQFKVIKDTNDYKLMEVEKLSLDSLIKLKDQLKVYHWEITPKKEDIDNLILVCNQIKKINRKAAKEEHVDYHLADSYYRIKQYDKAIKYSKIFLKIPSKHSSWEDLNRLSDKRDLCQNLCEIYKERHDTLTAVKYLLEVEKRWLYIGNYYCIRGWHPIELYKEIVELYTVLNDKKGVAKYQEKIKTLEELRK